MSKIQSMVFWFRDNRVTVKLKRQTALGYRREGIVWPDPPGIFSVLVPLSVIVPLVGEPGIITLCVEPAPLPGAVVPATPDVPSRPAPAPVAFIP
jgi:hypothetical protein